MRGKITEYTTDIIAPQREGLRHITLLPSAWLLLSLYLLLLDLLS